MTHAPQVAFAFFPYIADKQNRQSVPDAQRAQRCHDGQHGGYARAVVGNSRTVQAAALLPDVQRRACGKHRVHVRAERDVAVPVAGMHAENVADFIGVDRFQAELAKTCRPTMGPGRSRQTEAQECAPAPTASARTAAPEREAR